MAMTHIVASLVQNKVVFNSADKGVLTKSANFKTQQMYFNKRNSVLQALLLQILVLGWLPAAIDKESLHTLIELNSYSSSPNYHKY